MQMSRAEFERLVGEALDSLPDEFARLVDNVAVIVEDEPAEEDLELLDDEDDDVDDGHGHGHGHDDGHELLGIFRGIPLTERAFDAYGTLPNQIAIFRGPILRIAADRKDALREIRETVIHELGHYFGLDDDTMVY